MPSEITTNAKPYALREIFRGHDRKSQGINTNSGDAKQNKRERSQRPALCVSATNQGAVREEDFESGQTFMSVVRMFGRTGIVPGLILDRSGETLKYAKSAHSILDFAIAAATVMTVQARGIDSDEPRALAAATAVPDLVAICSRSRHRVHPANVLGRLTMVDIEATDRVANRRGNAGIWRSQVLSGDVENVCIVVDGRGAVRSSWRRGDGSLGGLERGAVAGAHVGKVWYW